MPDRVNGLPEMLREPIRQQRIAAGKGKISAEDVTAAVTAQARILGNRRHLIKAGTAGRRLLFLAFIAFALCRTPAARAGGMTYRGSRALLGPPQRASLPLRLPPPTLSHHHPPPTRLSGLRRLSLLCAARREGQAQQLEECSPKSPKSPIGSKAPGMRKRPLPSRPLTSSPPSLSSVSIPSLQTRTPAPKLQAEKRGQPREKRVGGGDDERLPVITLVALLAVFTSNQWSRSLIYYLNNFHSTMSHEEAARMYANVDLSFGNSEYSLLASLAFTSTFAVASIVAGRLADKYPRGKLAAVACVLWSSALGLGSLSQNYEQLFVSRAAMGLTQAVTNPASLTLLAEVTPPEKIATANAIFSSGIYLGGGLASLSILLDEQVGWRGTGIVVAAVGFVAALCAAAIRDPRLETDKALTGASSEEKASSERATRNGQTDASEPPTLGFQEVATNLFRSKATILLLAAATVRFMAGFTIAAWKAPVFLDLFPDEVTNFGITNALIIATAGSTSALIGGSLADSLAKKASENPTGKLWGKLIAPQARLLVPVIGTLLASPLWALTLISPSFEMASVALLFEYMVAECWFGPAQAGLYAALPDPRLRAQTQGVFSLLTAVGNIAPVAIGTLTSSGGLFGVGWFAETSIRDALLWTVCPAYIISAALFAMASLEIGNDQTNLQE